MKEKIKPIKAWALIMTNEIDPNLIYTTKEQAKYDRSDGEIIIPVLITPITNLITKQKKSN